MAGETQKASTGYNGKFYIDDGAGTLVKLVGVTGFGLPSNRRERVDATTLEDERAVTIPGRYETTTLTVNMNYRPGSDTDIRCHELNESGGTILPMKAAIPQQDGTIVEEQSFNGEVIGYETPELDGGATMTCNITVEVKGAVTRGAPA